MVLVRRALLGVELTTSRYEESRQSVACVCLSSAQNDAVSRLHVCPIHRVLFLSRDIKSQLTALYDLWLGLGQSHKHFVDPEEWFGMHMGICSDHDPFFINATRTLGHDGFKSQLVQPKPTDNQIWEN